MRPVSRAPRDKTGPRLWMIRLSRPARCPAGVGIPPKGCIVPPTISRRSHLTTQTGGDTVRHIHPAACASFSALGAILLLATVSGAAADFTLRGTIMTPGDVIA